MIPSTSLATKTFATQVPFLIRSTSRRTIVPFFDDPLDERTRPRLGRRGELLEQRHRLARHSIRGLQEIVAERALSGSGSLETRSRPTFFITSIAAFCRCQSRLFSSRTIIAA
ncbi:MAG: hypothetical protein ABJD07_13835 [Gemmatimonadaceae bacterium]